MSEDEKTSFWSRCVGVSPQDRRNQRLIVWTNLAWALAFVGTNMALSRGLIEGAVAWGLIAFTVILSLAVLVVYGRFLRQTDELQRLIQLEALALGFGGSLFGLFAYAMVEHLGGPPLQVSELSMVMIGLYLLGIIVGWSRYR